MRTPPRQEIGALTGLRGVAACWVAMYHGHEFGRLAGPAGVLLRHGYLAVDVFFVLSGFVMGLSYAHMFAPGFRARHLRRPSCSAASRASIPSTSR